MLDQLSASPETVGALHAKLVMLEEASADCTNGNGSSEGPMKQLTCSSGSSSDGGASETTFLPAEEMFGANLANHIANAKKAGRVCFCR